MLYLFALDDSDYIDPPFAIMCSVLLFIILFMITLVSLRRQKLKRERFEYQQRRAARREEAISQLNIEDEEFTEKLAVLRAHNRETHARHK